MAASCSLVPYQFFLFHRHLSTPSPKSFYKSILVSSSSSSSFTEVATNPIVSEGEAEPVGAGAIAEEEESSKTLVAPATEDPLFKGCKSCGREVIEKGCNGEGRIQGGIATVPGFGWWPIKAFRPCPGFVATGGRYRRKGQSMDEVAFGSDTPTKNVDSTKSRYRSLGSTNSFRYMQEKGEEEPKKVKG